MTEENGLSCPLRFYNMLVHLRTGSRPAEANVAVKNICQKDNLVFIDLYFYRSKKSQVIDSVYVKDIFDLSTEKFYASPELFIRDYCAFVSSQGCETESELPETPQFDFKHLEPIKDNLIILTFMAKCTADFNRIKNKAIRDYIFRCLPQTKALSDQYISSYLKDLNPNEDNFLTAVDNLKAKSPEEVEELIKEALKISASDGAVSYTERLWLAEIIQTLREYGIEPDIEF